MVIRSPYASESCAAVGVRFPRRLDRLIARHRYCESVLVIGSRGSLPWSLFFPQAAIEFSPNADRIDVHYDVILDRQSQCSEFEWLWYWVRENGLLVLWSSPESIAIFEKVNFP